MNKQYEINLIFSLIKFNTVALRLTSLFIMVVENTIKKEIKSWKAKSKYKKIKETEST